MTSKKLQFRRGSSEQWQEKNPILAVGEPGFDTVTRVLKVGDGLSAWEDLEGVSVDAGAGGGATEGFVTSAIQEHREEAEPHEAYDVDMPSLSVLFENGLV